MVKQAPIRVRASNPEDGYMLLAVVVMVALMMIALSVAAPIIAKDVRRQKEMESARRSEDYVRAVRLYYRKNKGYPPNMDALLKGTDIHYLRRKWIDPLTGKSDWRIIHTPKTKIHFPFGEELAGGLSGGLGSAGGLVSGGSNAGGGTTTIGSTSALGAGFGGASVASPTDGGSSSFGGSNTFGGSTSGANGTSGSKGSDSSSDSGMFGDSGGGPIYGVATSRTGNSILTPNQQTTYETWEFWYDPRIESFYQKGNPLGGGGMGSQSAAGFGQDGATGQPNSSGTTGSMGNGFGSSSGNGSSGFGNSSFGNSGSGNSGFGNTGGNSFGNSGGFGSGSPGSQQQPQ